MEGPGSGLLGVRAKTSSKSRLRRVGGAGRLEDCARMAAKVGRVRWRSRVYKAGIGKAWVTLGARWLGLQCANVKKAAGKARCSSQPLGPGRHLRRRRPEFFPCPTPLAEARSALGVHLALLAHWEHSVPPLAHQEPRPRRPLSALRPREPRRAPRTAGIFRRSRHRTHSGTSCKSARPSSLMLV